MPQASRIQTGTQVTELRCVVSANRTNAGNTRAALNCQVPAGGWTGRLAH